MSDSTNMSTPSVSTALFERVLETLVAIGKLRGHSDSVATQEAQETFSVIMELTITYVLSTRPESERTKIMAQLTDHSQDLKWLGEYMNAIDDEKAWVLALHQATKDVMTAYFEQADATLSSEQKTHIAQLIEKTF